MMTTEQKALAGLLADETARPLDTQHIAVTRAAFALVMDPIFNISRNDAGILAMGTQEGRMAICWFDFDGNGGYSFTSPRFVPAPTRWERFVAWVKGVLA